MAQKISLTNTTDTPVELVTTHHKMASGETIQIDEGVLKANGPWMEGALRRGWLVVGDPVDDAPEPVADTEGAMSAALKGLTKSDIDKLGHEDLDEYLAMHGLTMPDDGLMSKRQALKRAVFVEA